LFVLAVILSEAKDPEALHSSIPLTPFTYNSSLAPLPVVLLSLTGLLFAVHIVIGASSAKIVVKPPNPLSLNTTTISPWPASFPPSRKIGIEKDRHFSPPDQQNAVTLFTGRI
jgi:hypothetical protein